MVLVLLVVLVEPRGSCASRGSCGSSCNVSADFPGSSGSSGSRCSRGSCGSCGTT